MLRSRVVPAIAATALIGGGLYWQTRTGKQQPASRASKDARDQSDLSETLQGAAGTGGAGAKDQPAPGSEAEFRTQTKIYSNTPDTPSKKNPAKAREGGSETLGPVHPLQAGKHAGDPEMDLHEKKVQK